MSRFERKGALLVIAAALFTLPRVARAADTFTMDTKFTTGVHTSQSKAGTIVLTGTGALAANSAGFNALSFTLTSTPASSSGLYNGWIQLSGGSADTLTLSGAFDLKSNNNYLFIDTPAKAPANLIGTGAYAGYDTASLTMFKFGIGGNQLKNGQLRMTLSNSAPVPEFGTSASLGMMLLTGGLFAVRAKRADLRAAVRCRMR